MTAELLDLLLARLSTLGTKRALIALLRVANKERGLSTGAIPLYGTKADLLDRVRQGVNDGLIRIDRLAHLVDELEENGRQHIFLFDLTPDGQRALRSAALQEALVPLPTRATVEMYSDPREDVRTYFVKRSSALVVKQLRTATFWEKDQERSYSDATERATVHVLRRHRAVNLLQVFPEQGTAEIRIDRITPLLRANSTEIEANLRAFLETISPVLDADVHLHPTPIWDFFHAIVNDRSGTYMSTDRARDPSVTVNISNRRARDHGSDVRDHPSYEYSSADYARDQVNIYWDIEHLLGSVDPQRGAPERVHTLLSRFDCRDRPYAKVYVPATIPPEVLSSVTERIRGFVG